MDPTILLVTQGPITKTDKLFYAFLRMTSNFHPHLDFVKVHYVVLFSQNRYLYFDVGIANYFAFLNMKEEM